VEYDKDKVDEYTLALLYLVTHERHGGIGARAWKGFGWDTLNRLHEKEYISNPVGKAKSIAMDEDTKTAKMRQTNHGAPNISA
jgi:CRISPR/Cas system CMR-associated protein Cmr1 (group 7 of RAMP superfamily)